METTSPPAFTEEVVRDLDIQFTAGPSLVATLRAADSFDIDGTVLLTVRVGTETTTCNMRNVVWWSLRTRILRTKLPSGPPSVLPGSVVENAPDDSALTPYGHPV